MFTIRPCSRAEATEFWLKNSSGTVFTAPEVSEKMAHSCEWWLAEKGSEPFVLWPVALDRSGRPSLPHFSYYFGPVWSDAALSRAPSSRFADRLKAYETFIEFFSEQYGSLLFELSPQFLDVRAFSWWNHGRNDAPRFTIEPRYTAQIRNLQDISETELRARLRSVRRQETKRFDSQKAYTIEGDAPWDDITWLYLKLFEAQGIKIDSDTVGALGHLEKLANTDWARLTVARHQDSEAIVSAVYALRGKGTYNVVLALTHPSYKKTGVGSWALWNSILQAKSLGDATYDFNGANSPHRGDDKHSYGAEEVLYFRLALEQPKPNASYAASRM